MQKSSINKHVVNQFHEKQSGYILYTGPSALSGEMIVVILTIVSSNEKTGNIAQITYIPLIHYENSEERLILKQAVCGNCPLLENICYVLPMATNAIKRAYKKGNYKDLHNDKYKICEVLSKFIVRNGQDGDPLSIPDDMAYLFGIASLVHLSYTHQWRDRPEHVGLHMASVETKEQAIEAQSEGWNTFRIIKDKSKLMDNEVLCPNVENKDIQCMSCQLCTGNKCNVAVIAHGSKSKVINFYNLNN